MTHLLIIKQTYRSLIFRIFKIIKPQLSKRHMYIWSIGYVSITACRTGDAHYQGKSCHAFLLCISVFVILYHCDFWLVMVYILMSLISIPCHCLVCLFPRYIQQLCMQLYHTGHVLYN